MLQFRISRVVSDGKVNMLGDIKALLYRNSDKFPVVKKKIGINHKKVAENRKFYVKQVYDKIDFFYILVTQKRFTVYYMTIPPNIYLGLSIHC